VIGMSDKSIDKLNEQIKQLSSDQFDNEKSFDNVRLKVIKDVPKEDLERTMKLEKIDKISKKEEVEEDTDTKEVVTKISDTKEMSKKEIESLTKKIEKMKDDDEDTFDTTTGIFSNEVDEPLIKKAIVVAMGIFTIIILLIIILLIL
jgi:CHASE3 domain sensor protein